MIVHLIMEKLDEWKEPIQKFNGYPKTPSSDNSSIEVFLGIRRMVKIMQVNLCGLLVALKKSERSFAFQYNIECFKNYFEIIGNFPTIKVLTV